MNESIENEVNGVVREVEEAARKVEAEVVGAAREVSDRGAGHGRLIAGVVLLGLGTLFLAENLMRWDVDQVWNFWPLILAAFGVARLRRGWSGGAVFLIALSGWLLLEELGVWYAEDTWPVLIMALGGIMITSSVLRGRRASTNP